MVMDVLIVQAGLKIRSEGLTPALKRDVPAFLAGLLQSCWKVNPDERPSFDTLCATLNTKVK